jgi:subtilisin-like proprotein convertase family protein
MHRSRGSRRKLLATVAVFTALATLGAGVSAFAGVAPTFFFNSTPRAIPDASQGGGVLSKIKIGRSGRIADIEVGIRINHSFDDDLNIYLVSPTGKFVELSTDNGGSGNNYGTGSNSCRGSGSLTLFDDERGRSIRRGSAPFAGGFRPQTPLSALDGDRIAGTWRLMVFDDDEGAGGTIGCFAIGVVIR